MQFKRVVAYIEQHFKEKIYITTLAQIIGYNRQYFNKLFLARAGMTPSQFIKRRRLEYAHQLRLDGMGTAEAAAEAGFYDQSNYTRVLLKHGGELLQKHKSGFYRSFQRSAAASKRKNFTNLSVEDTKNVKSSLHAPHRQASAELNFLHVLLRG